LPESPEIAVIKRGQKTQNYYHRGHKGTQRKIGEIHPKLTDSQKLTRKGSAKRPPPRRRCHKSMAQTSSSQDRRARSFLIKATC